MKYFKKFETHNPDYLNYMNSEDKILPNLCYCADVEDVHLNKVDLRITATFNVTDISNTTRIFGCSNSLISEIEVDGTIIDIP